jgi:hypothetical protein
MSKYASLNRKSMIGSFKVFDMYRKIWMFTAQGIGDSWIPLKAIVKGLCVNPYIFVCV